MSLYQYVRWMYVCICVYIYMYRIKKYIIKYIQLKYVYSIYI